MEPLNCGVLQGDKLRSEGPYRLEWVQEFVSKNGFAKANVTVNMTFQVGDSEEKLYGLSA